MGILTYGMHISLDGYIEDQTGSIAFGVPDEEMHKASNVQARDTAAFLFGRRLYKVMEDFWTSPERADGERVEAEFAEIYRATPRIVFSDSLESVPDGCRLVRSSDARDEVVRLKAETDGILSIGGPRLAASVADLVDQVDPYLLPTVLGGGTPFYPSGHRWDLSLAEARVFRASGWTYLRYMVER
ncbi:dihydrofolate reductase family protein [Williamsia deligens]|uniref:Dihydrofolate reductase family protein n=1 Tax=Williamsia deligens TaxID=321325 RepID=A0ABW3G5M4_9NOCA|nr:dihydrofolate reductase family protein [Williamsia deligens]MCP2193567.1 Dihydrofolate reductase [Williamsia deligens]